MASSPYDDNVFATANTFTNVLHSTPQQGNTATMNLDYDQFPEPPHRDSDGSEEMSIEIGRGVKRGVYDYDDASSNHIFSFGHDNNQYEVSGTPPIRQRTATRKSDGTLRKEASVRRATESARANDALKRSFSGAKKRAVSDNAPGLERNEVLPENTQPTATFQARGSRFSRQISSTYTGLPNRFTTDRGLQLGQETPRRPAAVNATVQSATYTAQSFMLPDIPDITELVSGVQRNGTPLVKRGPVSRSRFTSASYKPQPLPDIPVTAMRVPEEEKAIYAGIQLLHGKNVQLETATSEAQKRAEEYENEVIDLQHQLHTTKRQPDSGLGSEEEDTVQSRTSTHQYRLQAKVKALQEQLDRAERKISISEITVSRVTKERDALITQIGTSYFNSEELAKENEIFRESYTKLQEENEDLKEAVENLENENAELRDRLLDAGSTRSHKKSTTQKHANAHAKGRSITSTIRDIEEDIGTQRSKQHVRQRSEGDIHSKNEALPQNVPGEGNVRRRRSSVHSERTFVADLATRIEGEVQKHRDEAAAKARNDQLRYEGQLRPDKIRNKSKSRSRTEVERSERIPFKRHASAPAEVEVQEAEPTTEFENTRQSRKSRQSVDNADQDLTVLSDVDELAIANLRRKIEAERQAKRLQNQGSTNILEGEDQTGQSVVRQKLPRKSSLKDLTSRTEDGTGRLSLYGETIDDIVKATKTVRVQSPHSSQIEPEQQLTEAGDISVLSNTSRRRRRAESTEGMTSAFIIPDITLHGKKTMLPKLDKACIQHNTASCTICAADQSQIVIDMPVPVTDREGYGDETNATIRPAQEPAVALAIVIKNLQDEVTHLKIQREQYNRLYNQHDPALSKRRRQDVKLNIDRLTAEIEKRSDQVYKLYDVLEGQKQAAQLRADGKEAKEMNEEEVEETLQSLGIDAAELAAKVGHKAPTGLDGVDDLSDGYTDELPWEGLSDVDSEAEVRAS